MIKKLMQLVKNYDTIMKIVEEHDKHEVKVTQVEPKKKGKAYSTFNIPKDQLDYIIKKEKGEI